MVRREFERIRASAEAPIPAWLAYIHDVNGRAELAGREPIFGSPIKLEDRPGGGWFEEYRNGATVEGTATMVIVQHPED